jgi:hypothetical protein
LGPWLVAIGGLNHDPYVEGGNTARIRHLYVRSRNDGAVSVPRFCNGCFTKRATSFILCV